MSPEADEWRRRRGIRYVVGTRTHPRLYASPIACSATADPDFARVFILRDRADILAFQWGNRWRVIARVPAGRSSD